MNWDIIGGIGVDAATVAFGDAAELGDDFVLETRLAIVTMSGSPEGFDGTLVLQVTREDCPLPVEVCDDADGQRIAARMCFTSDVDELDGTWRKVGRLVITGDRCVAMDPLCEGEGYRCVFDLPSGDCVAEVFDYVYPDSGQVDVLGLRIVRDDGNRRVQKRE